MGKGERRRGTRVGTRPRRAMGHAGLTFPCPRHPCSPCLALSWSTTPRGPRGQGRLDDTTSGPRAKHTHLHTLAYPYIHAQKYRHTWAHSFIHNKTAVEEDRATQHYGITICLADTVAKPVQRSGSASPWSKWRLIASLTGFELVTF